MKLYFDIQNVLASVTKTDPPDYNALALVTTAPQTADSDSSDEFTLTSTPKLLDLNGSGNIDQLAGLLTEVPLYRYNIELLLDDALTQHVRDPYLHGALITAFAGQPLPSTLDSGITDRHELGGALRHPMLEHLPDRQLAQNYLAFWRALGDGPAEYSVDQGVVGRHEEAFLRHFDGYVQGQTGKVRAHTLLGFGVRGDHTNQPLEGYIESGKNRARKMRVSEPNELLWAWLEADQYQLRRCRDIDGLMQLSGLAQPPIWIRADIFAVLEREAMKQVFAEPLTRSKDGQTLIEKLPAIRRAVTANAEGQVDELLQQLLSQTLNANSGYSGAAGKFAEAAERRRAEAKRL